MGKTKGRQEADEVDRQRRHSAESVLGGARHGRREDQLTPAARRRSAHHVGIALRVVVSCLLGAILVDAFIVSGLFVPVRVTSGSMAPGLRGPHRSWHCSACGQEFACGLESLPAARRPVICPYCRAENDASAGVDRAGNRVLVDRATLVLRPPERWERVVLDCPKSPSAWCVKRVIGLPGEIVEVRDGEIWIDHNIPRKSLAAMRKMAVLVHEQPTIEARKNSPNRWTSPSGKWLPHGCGFRHEAETAGNSAQDNGPIRWLEYHGLPPGDLSDTTGDGAILDESVYDQGESRAFATVNDLLLVGQFRCEGNGTLFFRGSQRGDKFLVRIDVQGGGGELLRNGQRLYSFPVRPLAHGRPVQIAWMLADRQVQLSIDGDVLVDDSFEPSHANPPAPEASLAAAPLAIGVRAAEVAIDKLALFRDVFYAPGPPGNDREYKLGPGEYYLLGDNSPHSQDSRIWTRPGVSRRNIVGRVLRW
jgi:signal peptidase I